MTKQKLFTPAGWAPLEGGSYGSEMVRADGRWWKLEDEVPGRIFGRPLDGMRYRHREYTAEGVREGQILVASDGTWKWD